jgi:UDP-N-acetylmuramate dehydrogenase
MIATPSMTSLRGALRRHEPLARHTTWRVGGPADEFFIPADLDDLAVFLAARDAATPIFWLGLGSNLLVRDGGIRGVVIATSGALNRLERHGDDRIRAEAGVACAKLARFSAQQDLSGAEFLAGIPGTVGGALAMNAGAFGGETWPIVEAVETINRAGTVHVRASVAFEVGYRTVVGPLDEWFVAGHFKLATGQATEGQARIKGLLARRGATQPTQQANAGSVFRNPPGDHAARLIETAGLKGACEGAACVSMLHANFIINTGGATAAQIETLIARVQQTVLECHGVALHLEVRTVGEIA